MRGSWLPHAKFSLQSLKFSLRYANLMFGMFLFEFLVFSTQKCEVVIFTKFASAFVHARLLNCLSATILLRVHVQCMHAQCDITRVHI